MDHPSQGIPVGSRKLILIGVGVFALSAAALYTLHRRSQRFEIEIVRAELAFRTVDRCESGRRSPDDNVTIPVGTRLKVLSVDWEGKQWPCFETRYQGETFYLTGEFFDVL